MQGIVVEMWVRSLDMFRFCDIFNQNITAVVWPISLKKLYIWQHLSFKEDPSFGGVFDQPITRFVCVGPACRQKRPFQDAFDRPIAGVVWPASLQQPSVGRGFNRCIAGVVRTASLEELSLRGAFDEPVTKVALSASLQYLHGLGHECN